ncbi:MAG: hypothetical protein ACLFTE_01560 [Salinivenus sp.]
MSRFPLLLLLFLVGLGATCSAAQEEAGGSDPTPDSDTLLAQVDTVEAPDRIAPSDTLHLRLRGTVGPNGCYSLVRVERERTPTEVTLRPVVRHSDQDVCTMAVVPLNEVVAVPPPFQDGSLRLVVPQTDRPAIRTTVRVEADRDPDAG